jgi:hypothetical protein
MIEVDTGRFTVAVFQDAKWARNGIGALKGAGIVSESLSIVGKDGPDVAALIQDTLGGAGDRVETAATGALLVKGPIVQVLQGSSHDFARLGLAGCMRRVGFLPHDGKIYETLTARGGVLVAIHSEPRAADALAVLHSYGGGNAAIGAWTGRV